MILFFESLTSKFRLQSSDQWLHKSKKTLKEHSYCHLAFMQPTLNASRNDFSSPRLFFSFFLLFSTFLFLFYSNIFLLLLFPLYILCSLLVLTFFLLLLFFFYLLLLSHLSTLSQLFSYSSSFSSTRLPQNFLLP